MKYSAFSLIIVKINKINLKIVESTIIYMYLKKIDSKRSVSIWKNSYQILNKNIKLENVKKANSILVMLIVFNLYNFVIYCKSKVGFYLFNIVNFFCLINFENFVL